MEKLKVLDLFSGEIVKKIETHPSYLISNIGRVFRYRKSSGYSEVIYDNSGDYTRVELWTLGKAKKILVHRLVAMGFCRNYGEKLVVNHIDGDKKNNHYTNLEWVTRSENQLHAYRNGLQKGFHKTGDKLSSDHKKRLCGSRWKYETHWIYVNELKFKNLTQASEYLKVSRQTVLNRCNSYKFPEWKKEVVYDSK